MTDAEIIAKLQWARTIAPKARTGPKWSISANIPPLKAGDLPIGVSVTFDYARSDVKAVRKAMMNLQKRAVAAYRMHNEQTHVPAVSDSDPGADLAGSWPG